MFFFFFFHFLVVLFLQTCAQTKDENFFEPATVLFTNEKHEIVFVGNGMIILEEVG